MALVFADRVKETTTTTGTGTLNLAGAVAGFRTFVAGIATGNTCYYALIDANGTDWEVGLGTVTDATPDTLSRTTILASSNAGAAITLSAGTHTVFCTHPAAEIPKSKTYAVFTPMTSCPPASNFATLDTRNSIPVLDFDDTTEEGAFWVGILPEAASLGSGLKVTIWFMATTATTGNARWGAKFEDMSATDLDADSFDTAVEATTAVSGTSGILASTTLTITTIDSLTAQKPYRLWVYRDVSDAADTVTGDLELVSVEVWSAA